MRTLDAIAAVEQSIEEDLDFSATLWIYDLGLRAYEIQLAQVLGSNDLTERTCRLVCSIGSDYNITVTTRIIIVLQSTGNAMELGLMTFSYLH